MGASEPGPRWGPLQLALQQKPAEARRLGTGFPGGGGRARIYIPGKRTSESFPAYWTHPPTPPQCRLLHPPEMSFRAWPSWFSACPPQKERPRPVGPFL